MAVCVCVSGVGGEVIVNIIFRASIVMAKKKKKKPLSIKFLINQEELFINLIQRSAILCFTF